MALTLAHRLPARPQAEDLGNLLDHYHVWAHTLFPKSKFKDTIRMVEKVCKKRSMTVRPLRTS